MTWSSLLTTCSCGLQSSRLRDGGWQTSGNRPYVTVGTRCSSKRRRPGISSKSATTHISTDCSPIRAAKPYEVSPQEGKIVTTTTQPFLSDVKELRRRARENIDRGPITDSYGLDADQACD